MPGKFDIAVIGCGVAGLTAVQHALLGGHSVAHVIGVVPMGGLVCNIGELHGYPSGAEPISGLDLAIGILSSNSTGGATEIPADATSVTREGDSFRISHSDGELHAKQIIAATGARLRMLDVPGAKELEGRGVSQCGWCDGPLYKDKHAVVVGGGDAALEEALHLAQFAANITLVARGDNLSARQSYVDRIRNHASIDIRMQCDVLEITGADGVSSIRVRDRQKGAAEEIACSGVFVFVGLQPNSEMFAEHVQLDTNGGIFTNYSMQTTTPGLFAVGAIRSGYGGRLVHAVGEAATAVMAAAQRCQR
ncbi:MAG: thioredoxin reductase (NADPH) [Alphaproteobacteria bacterium]|jgi:thioredoxin reductase (NADPH)